MGVSSHGVFSLSKIGQKNACGWLEQTRFFVFFLVITTEELKYRLMALPRVFVLVVQLLDRCWSRPKASPGCKEYFALWDLSTRSTEVPFSKKYVKNMTFSKCHTVGQVLRNGGSQRFSSGVDLVQYTAMYQKSSDLPTPTVSGRRATTMININIHNCTMTRFHGATAARYVVCLSTPRP